MLRRGVFAAPRTALLTNRFYHARARRESTFKVFA